MARRPRFVSAWRPRPDRSDPFVSRTFSPPGGPASGDPPPVAPTGRSAAEAPSVAADTPSFPGAPSGQVGAPSGQVGAPSGRERRAGALRIGVTSAVVVGLLWSAWAFPTLRGAVAWLDPRLVKYLYLALGGLIVVTAVRAAMAPGRPLLPARFRPWAGPAGLVGSMMAFCVPLFAAWHTGNWWGMIGGGVPYSDPHIYFGGAERLLFFGDLDLYNSRRPLNAMFLAARLAVTHLDLRLALILGALAMGAAAWLAARAVARDLGPVAGIALFVGIFGFARVYGPTPMTEPLGVTFGALALAVLWSAVSTRNRWLAVGGILLLTVALDARSGVLLLPVVLPLWLAYHLRRTGRRYDFRLLGMGAAAVVLGTSLNYVALAGLGGDTENVMGNGGFLVYGMAKGLPSWDLLHPAWHAILNDHPETWQMTDADRNRFVNGRAREEVLAHPGRFLGTAVQSELNYLRIAKQEVLLDVPVHRHRPLMVVGALTAIVALVVRARRRHESWRLLVDLGLFASMVVAVPILVSYVPSNTPPRWVAPALMVTAFVAFILVGTRRLACGPAPLVMALVAVGTTALCAPVLGVDTVRVFAATAPFAALPLALAVAVLTLVRTPIRQPNAAPAQAHPPEEDAQPDPPAASPPPARAHEPATAPSAEGPGSTTKARELVTAFWRTLPREAATPLVAGAVLLGVLFVGTPLAVALVDPPASPPRTCPDGRSAQPLFGGVAVQVVDDPVGDERLDVGEVANSTFTAFLPLFLPMPGKHFAGIAPPWTVIHGLTATGTDRFAVLDGSVAAPGTSTLYLCGDTVHDPETDATFAIYPDPVDLFRGRVLGS